MMRSRIARSRVGLAVALVTTTVALGVPAPARQGAAPALWKSPGAVESLDLRWGAGGPELAPEPPFAFVREDSSGTNPKVRVRDAAGRVWSVKWGREVHAEIFASRIVWAAGYRVEPAYFVSSGRIEGAVGNLDRARGYIAPNGSFRSARFELKDPAVEKLKDSESWAWDDNPFLGTRELNGLKVLVMLLSNWDNKDRRDYGQFGSNTAVWVTRGGGGDAEAWYAVSDWGGTMGRWGRPEDRWTTWDCRGYAEQTGELVLGVEGGVVRWGFKGQRADVTSGVDVEHVRWLLEYVGRLTDQQIRDALEASGATPDERECFARAVRERIRVLEDLSQTAERRPGNRT